MKTIPILEVVKAAQNEKVSSGYLAGSFVIGSGYDVFGEYCRATSVRQPIFNLGPEKTDLGSGLKTFELINVIKANDGGADKFEGDTLAEYSSDFSANLKLKGNAGFFKGEIDAAFKTSESVKVTTHFVEYSQRAYFYKLSLPTPTELVGHFTDGAKANFIGDDGMSPDQLVKEYGTHYLKSVIVGARCSYSCTVDTSHYESNISLATAAQLSFKSLTSSASADMSVEQKKAVSSLQSNSHSKARVVGGDPLLAGDILNGNIAKWIESVPNNMVFSALGDDSLVRISALIDDPDRKELVDEAIDRVYAANPKPDVPFIVPVYRFHHPKSPSRWYYTKDPKNVPSGFIAQPSIKFYGFNQEIEETVPIYRLSASNPARYRLSTDKNERNKWEKPEIAFYAYPGDGKNRTAVRGFTCDASSGESGWYYTTEKSVKGWTCEEAATFFVPKM